MDDGRIGGNAKMATEVESPPLSRLAKRLRTAGERFESGMAEVTQAGHRTADRMMGEVPPPVDEPRAMPPTMGFNGQYGDLENAVICVETLLENVLREAERMANRVTSLG